ncbi:MAG: hypothetical protein ACI857_002044 [Arenicella sp.]|jgi:hypothetical protein
MKKILFLFLITFSSLSFAEWNPQQMPYSVKSDSFSAKVPKGFCLVEGYAYSYSVGVANGKVSTLDGLYHTRTDSAGKYALLIPSTDTSIFFFKSKFSEVVVWSYKFQSQHYVNLNFNSSSNSEMIISSKPVIYLYSDKEIDVSLDLNYHGNLTFTYPKLDDAWQVSVDKEGIEYEGKKYPYLFWEGESDQLNFSISEDKSIDGEFVARNNVVSFLETKLNELGFNQTERADFISFWGPRMVKSEYILVQFVIDEDYEKQIAELNVTPTPDAARRVYMFFSPSSEKQNIVTNPQSFEGFDRNGFTLLEWGGTELKIEKEKL